MDARGERTGAGTLRGERTRADVEQAELERLTGHRFMPAGVADELDAALGDEATDLAGLPGAPGGYPGERRSAQAGADGHTEVDG